jgi:hypothetical protein
MTDPARYEGRDGNDIQEAIRYGERIRTMPVQGVIRFDQGFVSLPRVVTPGR